ncbi:hypothetical protein QF047_002174 [Arthrobacter sp. W4I7]|nr:hypothetical protein [Arthrobacter sp. W4I7]
MATLEGIFRNATMVGLMSPGSTVKIVDHTHVDTHEKTSVRTFIFLSYALMGQEQSSARDPRRVRKKLDRIQ